VSENSSINGLFKHTAALLLSPHVGCNTELKNYKVRTDTHCFELHPHGIPEEELPTVTTIVRFHKSDKLETLTETLCCLLAMQDCNVVPFIVAQDLSRQQIHTLEATLGNFGWPEGCSPTVRYYHSTKCSDMRSTMLNESLRYTTTRYVAFLDHDDLLMPHAYQWLLARLQLTGKAVAFGRVYKAIYESGSGLIIERFRDYECGYTYADFVNQNLSPLHGFMLDLDQFDLKEIKYFDNQRYMEDYYLTLQLFSADNADWDGLKENVYIGDYMHSIDRPHTLALLTDQMCAEIEKDDLYKLCDSRISEIKRAL